MKKCITLCLGLMAALSSWAQGFEFLYQGQRLADGETVIIAAEEDWFGDLSCETNGGMDPSDGLVLRLLISTNVTASATLQISHNSLDATTLQWCMGGECTPMNGQTSLTKRFPVMGSEQVQFDAIGISSEGYLLATLKVTIGLESHQVKIMFANGDVDGIRPIPTKESGETMVYDVRGRRVQTPSAPGVYLVADGVRVRKITIK